MEDTVRKRFEAWAMATRKGYANCFETDPNGDYVDIRTRAAWGAYQAAQPSLLELRDKLVARFQGRAGLEVEDEFDRGYYNALLIAIDDINAAFSPYVKGD